VLRMVGSGDRDFCFASKIGTSRAAQFCKDGVVTSTQVRNRVSSLNTESWSSSAGPKNWGTNNIAERAYAISRRLGLAGNRRGWGSHGA
jgi:hypothetical protein